jgi:hypothetical protein
VARVANDPKKPPAPSDLAEKFVLRLPDGMRDEIAKAAKANGRSMNSEIVARLQRSLATPQLKLNTSAKYKGISAGFRHGREVEAEETAPTSEISERLGEFSSEELEDVARVLETLRWIFRKGK